MRKARIILFPILVTMALIALGSRYSYSEYIFMKNGSIAEGTILGENKQVVTYRDKDNKTLTVPRSDVIRVNYAKMYLG